MLKVPIFYYHSIGNVGPETLPLTEFKAHLALINTQGFTPITFGDLLTAPLCNDQKYLVLTFDDGLLDNYEIAAPLLADYGYTATFFVIPGFDKITRWVNPKTRQWSDIRRPGFNIPFPSMQPNHRRELLRLGMEIGCHSMSHPKLNKIAASHLNEEIASSKKLLEDQLGDEIKTFCYPKGRYNQAVLNTVIEAGYQGACTTMPGYYRQHTPKFECGRFLVEGRKLFEKILRWSSNSHCWTEFVGSALRPPLKIKNIYF